jgi:hypothetical protein
MSAGLVRMMPSASISTNSPASFMAVSQAKTSFTVIGRQTSARMSIASGFALVLFTPRPRPIAWTSSASQTCSRQLSATGSGC